MSAKHSQRKAPPAPAPTKPTPSAATVGVAAETAAPSWLDSADPRKRLGGKIIFVALWLYVGALWLLALDQMFHWGIFGPKVPPVP